MEFALHLLWAINHLIGKRARANESTTNTACSLLAGNLWTMVVGFFYFFIHISSSVFHFIQYKSHERSSPLSSSSLQSFGWIYQMKIISAYRHRMFMGWLCTFACARTPPHPPSACGRVIAYAKMCNKHWQNSSKDMSIHNRLGSVEMAWKTNRLFVPSVFLDFTSISSCMQISTACGKQRKTKFHRTRHAFSFAHERELVNISICDGLFSSSFLRSEWNASINESNAYLYIIIIHYNTPVHSLQSDRLNHK